MKVSILIFLTFFTLQVNAQRFADQAPQFKKYTQAEVLDSAKGIVIFDRLIEPLGGDSIAYNKSGYNLQGWFEAYYTNGNTLHKGYYLNGKLQVFKNFYESGNIERSFTSPDPLHATVEIYYENGIPKRKIEYYAGKAQNNYEYYPNGIMKLQLENEKELKYITLKKTWFESGQIESSFELKDSKSKTFLLKNYYKNGNIKEEGPLVLSTDGSRYLKNGNWSFYDENGKNKKVEKLHEQ